MNGQKCSSTYVQFSGSLALILIIFISVNSSTGLLLPFVGMGSSFWSINGLAASSKSSACVLPLTWLVLSKIEHDFFTHFDQIHAFLEPNLITCHYWFACDWCIHCWYVCCWCILNWCIVDRCVYNRRMCNRLFCGRIQKFNHFFGA